MTETTTADSTPVRRRPSPLAITIVLVVLLVGGFLAIASLMSDVFWYQQVGYLEVFATQWIAAVVMFAIGFLAMAVPVFLAIDIAYRTRPVYARLTAQLDRYQEMIEPLRRVVKYLLPAAFGFFAGIAAAAQWPQVLLWLNREGTGKVDAEFGLDLSFFLFDLPVLQSIVAFASAILLISLIASVGTSYLYGGISFNGRDVRVSKSTRIQTAVIAALYLLLQAGSLWLDQYRTVTNQDGILTGAAFTEVHAVIPGKEILAGIAAIVAILFIITAFTGKWRLPVAGTALLIVASLVIGVGYPWAVQRFQVDPDEKSLESEYISRNIDATRDAYGLADVEVERYDAVTDATPGALRNDAVATANIRILDPAIVSPTFSQLEQIRQYYKFPSSLNVDRYEIDGKIEDTVSAVRDINITDQTGWYNRTLVYTHGYGLVAAYGNQRAVDGQPVFLESGIPTSGKLGEFEPRVYFGENSPEYSIVGGETKKPIEIDYPADDTGDESKQNMTTFTGNGGPVLEGLFHKLVYALKFQSMEILLSGAVSEGSQILYDRDPVDRVQKVAPYLTIDKTPYASVVDGRIVWIVDGYTTSSEYPYSKVTDMNDSIVDSDNPRTSLARNDINYIRNSVKATVDAYDGSISLYAWDTTDPVLTAWQNVFPTTLKPISDMSAQLMSHVRYPGDLFKVQREILGEYHVTDAGSFYSREDAWRTPSDPVSGKTAGEAALAQPPYYLTLAAGLKADPTFSIYSTYIPKDASAESRDILTGYLAADSNAGNVAGKVSKDYGTLKLLTLPKGNTVPGPGQVQNSFTTDPTVSKELNLLSQGSTEVISGNLLTLPVGGGLLYVQPVYVKAKTGTSFPILQKVLVSFGEKIAFEDTLDLALDALFGGDSGAAAGDTIVPVTPDEPTDGGETPATPDDTAAGGSTDSPALQEALALMKTALSDRDAAMKAGDWTAFGEADARLRAAITAALAAQ
ncbi:MULTISPECIES: UPF0182 family protein [unclassified Leucobacter]|uniref:UPF0182 family membrane protein n=1 Tax=unclassified Leucobacter TaxID=2621730 RepID=UPI00165E6C50|nr:UPF0182 family protein [Leucobacter sp. CX169]MBC9928012.1 UPF0182 family protein [Leucobacter sp. cx-169]